MTLHGLKKREKISLTSGHGREEARDKRRIRPKGDGRMKRKK